MTDRERLAIAVEALKKAESKTWITSDIEQLRALVRLTVDFALKAIGPLDAEAPKRQIGMSPALGAPYGPLEAEKLEISEVKTLKASESLGAEGASEPEWNVATPEMSRTSSSETAREFMDSYVAGFTPPQCDEVIETPQARVPEFPMADFLRQTQLLKVRGECSPLNLARWAWAEAMKVRGAK